MEISVKTKKLKKSKTQAILNKLKRSRTLFSVRRKLSNIPNINIGGCGISALAMYRWIKKHNPNAMVVFYFDNYEGDIFKANQKYFTKKRGKPKAPKHIFIGYNGKLFDCEKSFEPEKTNDVYLLTTINEHDLVAAINNKHTWNPIFNREYVDRIEQEVGVDLSDIIR